MEYLNAFLCGGILCAVGQIIIDKTQLTPARILTGYVVVGVLLSALGLYEPLAQWGGAGATVPLTGFGHTLAKGVREAVASDGWLGVFTGGLTAAAGGIAAAVVAGVLAAALFRPGDKRERERGGRCRPVFFFSFFFHQKKGKNYPAVPAVLTMVHDGMNSGMLFFMLFPQLPRSWQA